MGLIQESEVGKLLQDPELMDQVVTGLMEDSKTMETLASDIADKLQDKLEDDPELRKRLVGAAITNEAFKKRLIDKLISELG